eukprot:scaffold197272_cov31-Tisochrysis_lutea.AAC.4
MGSSRMEQPYTREECAKYLEHLPNTFEHSGSKINKEAFLDSSPSCSIARGTSRRKDSRRRDR